MRMVKVAFINYLVWIKATKFLGSFVPSIIIVKITMNIIILTDNRTSFVYVAYRVQYNAVVFFCFANTFYPLFLQCHIGQEIEEAFKDTTLIGYIALYECTMEISLPPSHPLKNGLRISIPPERLRKVIP